MFVSSMIAEAVIIRGVYQETQSLPIAPWQSA